MKNILVIITALLYSSVCLYAQSNAQYSGLAIDARNGNAYGWAINYNNYSEANKRALAECEKNGEKCHIVLNFRGGCGVYVVEKRNTNLYGWGVANTRAEAEKIAMNEAKAQGGKNLMVRVWGCNGESKLKESKVFAPKTNGTFVYHFFKNDLTQKAFVSEVYYQPAVVKYQEDKWVWSADAKEKMSPKAQKFIDAVIDDLYGYLGENKNKAFTQNELNWKAMSELKSKTNYISTKSFSERKILMDDIKKEVTGYFQNKGFEIIKIEL